MFLGRYVGQTFTHVVHRRHFLGEILVKLVRLFSLQALLGMKIGDVITYLVEKGASWAGHMPKS